MTEQQTEINHIISEINTPKHRLIEYLRRLKGLNVPRPITDGLEDAIAELEIWQNKHKQR